MNSSNRIAIGSPRCCGPRLRERQEQRMLRDMLRRQEEAEAKMTPDERRSLLGQTMERMDGKTWGATSIRTSGQHCAHCGCYGDLNQKAEMSEASDSRLDGQRCDAATSCEPLEP